MQKRRRSRGRHRFRVALLAGLALGVLEALACAGLTVLLALLGASVTRQETSLLQRAAAIGVFSAQGASDAVAQGFCLCAVTTASDGSEDVVLLDELELRQRLTCDHARGCALEVFLRAYTVDQHLTRTVRTDPHTCHCGLTLAGGVLTGALAHYACPSSLRSTGCCAAWGCSAVAYTFNFLIICRASLFLGNMPLMAFSTGTSG